jgi:hypothetical protein
MAAVLTFRAQHRTDASFACRLRDEKFFGPMFKALRAGTLYFPSIRAPPLALQHISRFVPFCTPAMVGPDHDAGRP